MQNSQQKNTRQLFVRLLEKKGKEFKEFNYDFNVVNYSCVLNLIANEINRI